MKDIPPIRWNKTRTKLPSGPLSKSIMLCREKARKSERLTKDDMIDILLDIEKELRKLVKLTKRTLKVFDDGLAKFNKLEYGGRFECISSPIHDKRLGRLEAKTAA